MATLCTTALNLVSLAGFRSIRTGIQAVMHDITALLAMAQRQPEALLPVATRPNEGWATDLCRVCSALAGGHDPFPKTSFKILRLSAWSATSRLSRAFSSSRAFSRSASLTCKSP
jgi:hypothetical protein